MIQTKTEVPKESSSEFRKAGVRIQDTRGLVKGKRIQPTAKALAWVLNFAQEDAREYSLGERANKGEEVKRFAQDAGLGPDEPLTPIRACPGSSDKHWLLMLQLEVKAYLDLYVTHGQVRTNGVTLDLLVSKTSARVSVIADARHKFLYQVFHLLADLGPRIHQCRRCRRLFLAVRSDKKWCSGICQAMQYKIDHPKKQATKKGRNKGGNRRGTKR